MRLVPVSDATDFRAVLEQGNILFFPDGGFEIPAGVRTALTGATQDARSFHKNIAYKPAIDQVSGLVDRVEADTVRPAMREYSRCALEFMTRILPDYAHAWKVDYASFRSIEERGRDLPLNKRNDLLHVDSFPTRPVFGDMILRCFTNVNPEQSREWITSDPFAQLARQEAVQAGFSSYAKAADSPLNAFRRGAARMLHKAGIPVVDRSPYDEFMLHFHDWLKGNREYQEKCPKYSFSLPPGSTWLVFTDLVPHAVLGGRLALEQTVIISRQSLADREAAPASILEKMAGRTLTV
ncbi:MAG TPA: Kdo hydroxylase family protein [Bryobacteraceae bacterium]|nr:Kdo hydroxylase family protein [Bryobacteraceae bacterium]